ncbi:TetR/AcrR family transcriptional regulator [Collimonas pratensis]|uniref:Bacterial regulatory s, tetR family protein n=1 Tax=Collimonas pratensis TaxID=279113 RepID=A0ABM5Z7J5_9BURK|nr:TetR/AcrR family transcriptional regulator [Collimonas pratensis]AMP14820.1 bacterial regulatory s, tetR family protein [Collimonas pratensis]
MSQTSKSELTYAAIVNAALAIAAAEGIGKLSLGEVAKQLDISKSGVFSRVGSLEALQEAALEEFDRRFSAEVFLPSMALPRGLPRLSSQVKAWIGRASDPREVAGCLYIAGAFEYDDIDGPLRDRIQRGVIRWRATMRRTIIQAIEVGHLRPDSDPEQLIFEIYSLIVGLTHDIRFMRDNGAVQRVHNAYSRLISTYRSFNYQGA